ncbi:hypothetical protein CAEBREN_11677 [Caenorhabditis brenneri]|uniref:Uncharacterized protein n=1 Tax=Caenorhabditis brenneri TaxID=135651 RepID=G0MRS3_CAEBE|nr:hypothetical protein CAEBREN_11677 [Caenorhabditis brenneri]
MAHCLHPEKFFPVVKSVALPKGTLNGKVALVTGGGTGLGKAIATTFAHLGASVAIAARRLDVLEKTANEIRSNTGGVCEAFQMDVKDPAKVAKAFDEVEKKLGHVPDILINNAAGNFIMATERLSPNAYGTIVDIVLKGTLHVTTELGRRCIQQKRGASVLSITTLYAKSGAPFVVPSAVSKAGVENMTKSLAVEWAKHGLRFNAIAPGPIPTEGAFGRLFAGELKDAGEAMASQVPVGRLGSPEEIANLAAFMSSDFMSWMNGAIIDFDGGQQHIHHGSHMGDFLHNWDNKQWEETENLIRGRTGKDKKSKL